MADWQSKLVSKVTLHGGIEKALAKGIESDHFEDEQEEQKIWDFLLNHVRKYKSSPSPEAVKESFPEYKWEIITDPLDYVIDQFITSVKRRNAVKAFSELADIIDENEYDTISHIDEIFIEKAQELAQVIPSTNISKFSNMNQRIDLYKARKAEGITPGIPFGIRKLDEDTLGLQPHQYVTISGFTGLGKTTLGLVLAINHYLEGYNPMIISLEMGEDEIYRKLDAMALGFRQHALKEMTLPGTDIQKWEKYAEKVKDAANDIIVVDVDYATPEKVFAETARWKPDVVIVDYVQLMIGPKNIYSRWEKIDYCSRMLKAQARQMRIPVYGLSQTNADGESDGANLANLAGSKSIGMHSDIVLGLNQDDDMRAMKKIEINIKKNRGGPVGAVIPMRWDHVNSDYREWKPEDAFGEVRN